VESQQGGIEQSTPGPSTHTFTLASFFFVIAAMYIKKKKRKKEKQRSNETKRNEMMTIKLNYLSFCHHQVAIQQRCKIVIYLYLYLSITFGLLLYFWEPLTYPSGRL